MKTVDELTAWAMAKKNHVSVISLWPFLLVQAIIKYRTDECNITSCNSKSSMIQVVVSFVYYFLILFYTP